MAKMPYDFRSQDQRTADSGRTPGTPIGFHELRQACEISALREDLERVLQDTGALRDSIEDAVEQVRQRFSALTAEELANSETMAPLLQFAVSTLLSIRDEARRINTQTGPVDDDDRPTRAAADARPQSSATAPAASQTTPQSAAQIAPQTAPQTYAPPPSDEPTPSFVPEPVRKEPPPPPAPAPVLSPFVPRAPAPAPQRPANPDPTADSPPPPSWLSPLSGRKGGSGANGSAPRSGNVDWLSRPKR
ncbi:hypothetical protein FHW79_005803 [Azospirillum sp. OGB3]|uniref:hypothetical protein n=1 Tax=Azospirillum sp. OGB3 TaxID=2587012 RepID=UPI0016064802|nr:hypothetical protein [Azospirillum sp. OGB3]MBB3268129.1 hypothetical protein [Azospirillum sp. OGB3]